MRRTALVACAGLLLAAATAGPASAITNGSPDGDLHPSVGAIVADWSSASPGPDVTCSGTLIDTRVFLTVAHCTTFLVARGHDIRVTFSPHYDEDAVAPTGLIAGTAVAHPLFGSGGTSDPNDIAVVLLAESPGAPPAQLPGAGLLDQLQADHALDDATFTAVGYGETRADETGGWHARVPRDGIRRHVSQQAHALLPSWLVLTSNAATGDGGSCYGDSGGPHFLGGVDSTLVVSTTVKVDSTCRALDQTYRLDTLAARAFLAQFVDLP
jgi:hypothetical protein